MLAWIIHKEMSVIDFLYKVAVDMISSHDHQPSIEEEDFEETILHKSEWDHSTPL